MKLPIMVHKRNSGERSKKLCCCGSHSANDTKKNKQHHSTKVKLLYRKAIKLKLLRLENK